MPVAELTWDIAAPTLDAATGLGGDTALVLSQESAELAALPTEEPARPLPRVLHLINGEHYSGAERVQDLLALRLPDYGFEVEFACVKPGRFPSLRQSQSSRLFEMPMRSKLDPRPLWRLVELVRKRRYTIVHTHTPRTALVGRLVAALTGTPLVHHVHSPTDADSTHRWRNRVNAIVERASLAGAAGVIAVSESMGRYAHAMRIPSERITVVPNGVPAVSRLASRQPPQDTWTLGTVALFRPRKGIEVLLAALAALLAQGLPVKLRAVGGFETASYEAKVKSQVVRLGLSSAVEWTGFTQNVPAELARMDLFVLPSLFGEGLPMVVLEAMAGGVPVVTTRVEGAAEAIRHGIDGLVTEPANPPDLVAAIARYVRGEVDWNQHRQSAFKRQREQFSDHSMARRVAAVYREILDR